MRIAEGEVTLRTREGLDWTAKFGAIAAAAPWMTFGPIAPLPTNLLPCWVQTPPLRVKTQTAPSPELLPSLNAASSSL